MIHIDRMRSGDVLVTCSVSGGKDSTATALHLREMGIPYRAVFADTGWESDETYRYIDDVLQAAIGPIETVHAQIVVPDAVAHLVAEVETVLGRPSPMVRRILAYATFPTRKMRWCTDDLKTGPIRTWHHRLMEDGRTVVSAIGVRADESEARSKYPEWQISPGLDVITWSPILTWTLPDVVAILGRHGVPPNPLYLRGAGRVGCWPCVMARKEEYALLRHDERRVEALRLLERFVGDLAEARAEARGTTLEARGHKRPAWYWGVPDKRKGALGILPPIDRVLEWAATGAGGRQGDMFRDDTLAREGCARWGMCETARDAAVAALEGA